MALAGQEWSECRSNINVDVVRGRLRLFPTRTTFAERREEPCAVKPTQWVAPSRL
jgi:hypothetical protein